MSVLVSVNNSMLANVSQRGCSGVGCVWLRDFKITGNTVVTRLVESYTSFH